MGSDYSYYIVLEQKCLKWLGHCKLFFLYLLKILIENTEKTMAHTEGHILVLELAQGPALAHWHIYWHGV